MSNFVTAKCAHFSLVKLVLFSPMSMQMPNLAIVEDEMDYGARAFAAWS